MTPEEKQKLDEMYQFVQDLRASASIPFDVDRAFADRFSTIVGITLSSKSASSESQSVNEAGTGSYTVLKNPDKYLQKTINGTVYYIPVFT